MKPYFVTAFWKFWNLLEFPAISKDCPPGDNKIVFLSLGHTHQDAKY